MKLVVDESVSYAVVKELRKLEYEVISIGEKPLSGLQDEGVYNFAVKEKAILITRDFHFTNSLRFPPQETGGIIYIRNGNLRAEEEVALIARLFRFHNLDIIKGKLVTLYKKSMKVR